MRADISLLRSWRRTCEGEGRPAVPIYIYHIKPAHQKKVTAELRALGRKNVKVLQEGKTYNF